MPCTSQPSPPKHSTIADPTRPLDPVTRHTGILLTQPTSWMNAEHQRRLPRIEQRRPVVERITRDDELLDRRGDQRERDSASDDQRRAPSMALNLIVQAAL